MMQQATSKCCKMTSRGKACPFMSKHEYDGEQLCGMHLKAVKATEDCSICLDPMSSHGRIKLTCGHYFHKECLSQCKVSKCPQCRGGISSDECLTIFRKSKIDPLMSRVYTEVKPEVQLRMFEVMHKVIDIVTLTDPHFDIDMFESHLDIYGYGMGVIIKSFENDQQYGTALVESPLDMAVDFLMMSRTAVEHLDVHGTYDGFGVCGYDLLLERRSIQPNVQEGANVAQGDVGMAGDNVAQGDVGMDAVDAGMDAVDTGMEAGGIAYLAPANSPVVMEDVVIRQEWNYVRLDE